MPEDFKLFYTWTLGFPARYHRRSVDGEYFEWLFSMLEGTGVTFLYRCNVAGRVYYPSRHMSAFDHSCVDRRNPEAAAWHGVADVLDNCDPFAEAVSAARRHGVPIWAWFNWNEFQCIRLGWVHFVDPLWYQQPRKYWCSRDGSRFYHGVPAFGDEDVRQRLLGLADEAASYGVDGMYLSTRSHSWVPCFPSPDAEKLVEPFGFNDCVVDAYRNRHGVDIRYEDYDREEWLKIKGEQFSGLLCRVGNLLHRTGVKFVVGIESDRYALMGMRTASRQWENQLQLYKDWEAWAASGAIDGLCAEESCPHEQKLTGGDVEGFRRTLPADLPVYSWANMSHWVSKENAPFSFANWVPNTVDEVVSQIEMTRETGASGIVLHPLCHFTSMDTAGESVGGYGILPRTEYLDALRKMRAQG